jgi:hypothetical protein
VAKSEKDRPTLIFPDEAAGAAGTAVSAGAAGAWVSAGAAGAAGVADGVHAASIAAMLRREKSTIEKRLDFISHFPFITFVVSDVRLSNLKFFLILHRASLKIFDSSRIAIRYE